MVIHGLNKGVEKAIKIRGRLFLATTFLSSVPGSRSVMEDLSEEWCRQGYVLMRTSHYRKGLTRGIHILLQALLRLGKYDVAVVDVFSGKAFLWAEALAFIFRIFNCPFILVLRGGNLPVFSRQHSKRVRVVLQRATVVTAPSPYLIQQMRSFRKDILLIPNPVDLCRYPFKPREKPQPKLVWLRAFHEIYNPLLAIAVLSRLLNFFPEMTLLMIGPDKDGSLKKVQQDIEKRELTNKVYLQPGILKAEVPAWLSRGDIFLNTTNIDNTPVSVIEAMACGLCVVSTNVGGIPYLLEHGKDALLVSPNDVEGMAEAVRKILKDPGLSEKLSRNARQKVEQFDWPKILPQWEALFNEMLEKHV